MAQEPQKFIKITIYLNQQEVYEKTEEIIREIISDALGGYVTYDPDNVHVEIVDKKE